jgi:hypothetical protein
MTLPAERTRAVLQTRIFLEELADASLSLPDSVRHEAVRLLRHYPHKQDMHLANLACPTWFGPVVAAHWKQSSVQPKGPEGTT